MFERLKLVIKYIEEHADDLLAERSTWSAILFFVTIAVSFWGFELPPDAALFFAASMSQLCRLVFLDKKKEKEASEEGQ